MPASLPDVIVQYLQAQPRDATLIDRYFTDDAVVIDRGDLFKGRESMIAWQEELTRMWPERVFEARKVLRGRDDEHNVQVRVTGPFPGGGSSMQHLFRFRVQGDRIAALEIV